MLMAYSDWMAIPSAIYQLISDPWRHVSMASSGNLSQGVLAYECGWHSWNSCVFIMDGGVLFHGFSANLLGN